jgi:Fe2+ transport system protein B
MAGTHKGHLGIGIALAISFLVVLFLIFSPLFGEGKNGLQFADDMFNRLAKGSSDFIPEVEKNTEKFMGNMFNVTLKMEKEGDKPGDAEKRADLASKLYTSVEGTKVEVNGSELKIEGDLGKVLKAALADARLIFDNKGEEFKTKYATDDEKKMFRQWHNTLTKIDKAFKKEKKIEESKIVSDVTKKAIEAAYNFYKVDAVKVKDKAGLMTFLLVFYVVYTMWWGFAIFFIFEGIGLTMTKAKVKKEV